MSKTSKKITFNMVNTAITDIDQTSVINVSVGDTVFELNVKHRLGLKEANEFCYSVAKTCSDIREGIYNPFAIDFAIRLNTLVFYAGFEIPKSFDKAYNVLYFTNVFDEVAKVIDHNQFSTMCTAAAEIIEYNKETILAESANGMSQLIDKLSDITQFNQDMMENIDIQSLQNDISKITPMFDTANVDGEVVDFPSDDSAKK